MRSAHHIKTARAVRRKYNVLSFLYDWIWPNFIRETIGAAVEPLQITGSERFLDIGCGTGELEKALVKKNPQIEVVGIDISNVMLHRARKKLSRYPSILFQEGDFLKMELEENAFDAAFSISNLHYFHNPQALFEKTNRHLKKGGRFILVDWNGESLKGRIYNQYMKIIDSGFAKAYTEEEVTEFFENAGFLVEDCKGFQVGLFWHLMRLVGKKI